jgi:hypothetical protein
MSASRPSPLSAFKLLLTLAAVVSLTSYGVWATAHASGGADEPNAGQTEGSAAAAPVIISLADGSATRSGRLLIKGSGFGATQAAGRVEIGGVKAHVSRWSDTLIAAYVAESTPTGDVNVQVFNAGWASNPLSVEVTPRPAAEGRVRWRFTVDADYVPRRAAVGPDGTVYVNDVQGRLYALAPDGGLKWVFQAGLIGAMGSVSVGADGTVYVGGLVPKDPAATCQSNTIVNVEGIFAVNPDGTQKWLFAKTCDGLLSGPDVGPDGKIHAVTDAIGIGAFALNHDGTPAHAPTGRFGVDGSQGTEVVFGPAAPGQPATQKYFQYESGGLFGYTLGGQRVFLYGTNAVGITQPAVGRRTGTIYTSPDHQTAGRFFAVSPQGTLRWVSPIRPISSLSIADAPPSESAVYVVQDGGKLHRVNPEDGSVVWTFTDNNEQLYDPVASPDDRLILVGGRVGLYQPGFFEAVSSDGRQLWKELLPTEPGHGAYGQLMPSNRARFTADGQTAYIAADILGDGGSNSNSGIYSYFYALNTAPEGETPNTAPSVRVTSPVHKETFGHLSDITVTAEASDAEGSIARVEFHRVSRGIVTPLGTDTTAPYSVVAEDVPGENHTFYAVAYDDKGLKKESEGVTVQVTYWPPRAEITSPANGAWFPAGSDVTLTAEPDLRDGRITKIEFVQESVGVVCAATAPPYTCVWRGVPAGVYTLSANTWDDGTSHINSEPVTIAVGEGRTALHTISGRASEPGGAPIPGVTVTMLRGGRTQPTTAAAATTDADGRYSFKNLEPHYTYDVKAHHAEFSFRSSPTIGPFADMTTDQVRDFKGGRPEPRPAGAPPVAWASYYGSPERLIDGRTMLALDAEGNSLVVGDSGMNFAVVKYDPAGKQLWARVVDGGGRYQTTAFDIAADAAGSVYVTGQFWAGSVNERDWLTIKFDAAGNEVWRRTYNGPSNITDNPSALEIDAAGNVYVVGEGGADFTDGRSVATVKYDTDGNVLWSRFEAGASAQDVKLDAAGNAYVVGVNAGRVNVFKYDPAGNLLWKYAHSTGSSNERADVSGLHLGGDGGVYVLADITDVNSPTSGYEPVVFKVNGADGRFRWVSYLARKDGQRLGMGVYAMGVDAAGNSYVTGVLKYQANDEVDAFTLKVGGADGAVQWMDVYAEPAGDERWNADNNIAVDAAGNAYAYFTSMRDWDDDIAIVKYRTDGTREWVHLFDNPYHTGDSGNYLFGNARNILLDARGDIIFTGDSSIPGQSLDFVTVKLAHSLADPTATPQPTPTPAPTPVPTTPLTNFALAANGGVATASSTTTQAELPGMDFSPSGAINGDRKGLNWEHGGGWRDATNDTFPDWLQVNFNGAKSISEVSVFSLQDNYASPSVPTEQTTFAQFGVSAFDIYYWDGSQWAAVPGASVAGNDKVWRKLTFPAVNTTALRLVVRDALAGRSRLVEFEAWGTAAGTNPAARLNAALSSNGGVATASSTTTQQELPGMDFAPSGVINGDRKGLNWERGGGWRDATDNAFPDWLEVAFAAPTAVDEINVFSLQDNYTSPAEPTEATSFNNYGLTSFVVQHWDGAAWAAVPGGTVTNNSSVWRKLTFPAVTTTKVRVVVNAALAGRSRLVEVEAWGTPAAARVNHAAAANGGSALASSTTSDAEYPGLTFPASSVVNGDRRGLNWEHGGGWRDGTGGAFPDWVEVSFAGARKVDEVNVFSLQDGYANPLEPSESLAFTQYGVTAFEVQYWDGAAWATVPGGVVTGNNLVRRKLTFAAVTTTKVRVVINDALGGRSRLVEVEAIGPAR